MIAFAGRCQSWLVIGDTPAIAEVLCTQPDGHDGPHRGIGAPAFTWPRLEPTWGRPLDEPQVTRS